MPKHSKNTNKTNQSAQGNRAKSGYSKMEAQISSLRGQLRAQSKGSALGGSSSGNMILRKTEFWSSVNGGITRFDFLPGLSGLARLDRLAAMFDLWKLLSAKVVYKTASGTTLSGMVHLGIDYDSRSTPTTTAGVANLSPVISVPVWKSGSVTVSTERCNKLKWMFTANSSSVSKSSGSSATTDTGFSVCISNASTIDSPGELWIDYAVEFSGPTIPRDVHASSWTTSYTGDNDVQLSDEPRSLGLLSVTSYGDGTAKIRLDDYLAVAEVRKSQSTYELRFDVHPWTNTAEFPPEPEVGQVYNFILTGDSNTSNAFISDFTPSILYPTACDIVHSSFICTSNGYRGALFIILRVTDQLSSINLPTVTLVMRQQPVAVTPAPMVRWSGSLSTLGLSAK